jgi:hypothetical protein
MSNKIYGTILLDENDCYLCDGKLPHRPLYDKSLLTAMVSGEIISKQAAELLPKSITDTALDITNQVEPSVPITVKEIDGLTDILIVIRSTKECKGECKKFRLDRFKRILSTGQLEIWRRK